MTIECMPLAQWSPLIYRREGVARILLALQDECGEDVLLLLLAGWLWQQRRVLDAAGWTDLRRNHGAWRDGVLVPLRGVRRYLADSREEALYSQLKVLEVEAELAQLVRLQGWADRAQGHAGEPLSNVLAAACEGEVFGRRAELLTQLARGMTPGVSWSG